MPTPLDYFSAIAPPIGNLISTIVANQQNKSLMRENRAWQENMMRYQNEYNSLSAQRARAVRAGIAPNPAPAGAAGVQSVYQPNMQSANFDGLGSVADKFREASLKDEAIKQQKDATYRSGIESSVYLQRQLLSISKDMADLEKIGLDNKEARLRYEQLSSQYDQFLAMFDDTVELNHQNALRAGVGVRADEAAIVRADNEFKELVRNHKTLEAIAYYNAKTSRIVGESEASRNYSRSALNESEMYQANALTEKIRKETHLLNATMPSQINIKKLQELCEAYNVEERKAAAATALIQSKFLERKSYSPILYALQVGFGLDTDDVLSIATWLGIGKAATSGLRSSKSYHIDEAKPPSTAGAVSYEEWRKTANPTGYFKNR